MVPHRIVFGIVLVLVPLLTVSDCTRANEDRERRRAQAEIRSDLRSIQTAVEVYVSRFGGRPSLRDLVLREFASPSLLRPEECRRAATYEITWDHEGSYTIRSDPLPYWARIGVSPVFRTARIATRGKTQTPTTAPPPRPPPAALRSPRKPVG